MQVPSSGARGGRISGMDTLWAPWRIGYVTGEKPRGCIFCEKAAANADAANYILHRGESCFVLLNLFPYNNGHLMVVPYRHEAGIEALDARALAELMGLTQRAVSVLRQAMGPSGFNIGINQGTAAGAGVAGSPAPARGAALGRGHELHARAGGHPRDATVARQRLRSAPPRLRRAPVDQRVIVE